MFYDLKDKKPKNSGENWVAPNATIIGDVTLEKNSSIWFNATLRGDVENIHIGEGSNIQDGSVLHTDPGYPLKVGKNVTVGHMVMLHGCTIGDNSLIGIGAAKSDEVNKVISNVNKIFFIELKYRFRIFFPIILIMFCIFKHCFFFFFSNFSYNFTRRTYY